MFETQNDYYIPLICIGIVVVGSALVYYKNKYPSKSSTSPPSSFKYNPLTPSPKAAASTTFNLKNYVNTNNSQHSSSSNTSQSSSLIERTNLDIPNQKYRKQDPDTRYDDDGTRYQCVSIPYRIVDGNKVEIFMITSRNKGDYIFPGGGWEKKETGPECAQREAWEEAGIRGNVTTELVSDQKYTSDKGNKSRLWGYLLEVTKVEEEWPEPERRRKWMSIDEAEIALPQKRRKKFGALWRNGINYFIEQNLYHLPANQAKLKNHHRSHINI